MSEGRYRLNDLARAEIDELRADGITLTDDDVVAINQLAAEVATPAMIATLARGTPIEVGHVTLWPLTLAGADWYDSYGYNTVDPEVALAYALAHGHTEAISTATWANVKNWRRRLKCRRRELTAAIAACLAQDEQSEVPTRDTDQSNTPGQLSAMMVGSVGGTPEMWERQLSIGYMRQVINALASAHTPNDKVGPDVVRATMALGMYCEQIRSRASG